LKSDVVIGLVPCGVGGTPLRRWVKGGDLYAKAVERAKMAMTVGELKGVLWHQGESDTTSEKYADTYRVRLAEMLKDLRQDLNQPRLPIVVGQLGDFLKPEKYPYADTVRQAIRQIPQIVSECGYADSSALEDKGDGLHFSADAQKEMGERFAKAMQVLQEKKLGQTRPD
jgi:lysophospholipase L1-like esterase